MVTYLKKLIRHLINKMGYDFINLNKIQQTGDFYYENKRIDGFCYEKVIPHATYAPWHSDSSFLKVYEIIKPYTLVDIYRCFELWKLVEECEKIHEYGDFLEVGVWRGGTAALMAKKLQLLNRDTRFFLADTFTGVVKAGKHDMTYKGGEHSDTSRKTIEDLLDYLNIRNNIILTGIFPDETAHLIPSDTRFKFCHIDVDTYQSAKDILDWVWERLLPNGIVVFDDYGFDTCNGVAQLVEQEHLQKDRIFIHNLNGHAIFVKNTYN